jgi:DNA-binding transcriptional ArsR family regulator
VAGKKQQEKKQTKRRAAKTKDIVDPRLATALGHPLRVHILGAIAQRSMSPVEVARETGEAVSKVSYHFNVLRECECIELSEEVPKRGAVEHVYRGTKRALLTTADWKQLPKSIQGGATGVALLGLFKNALAAVEAGTFDARDDRHLSWSPLTLDEPAWEQMNLILDRTREEVVELAAEAAERLAKGNGKSINTTLALAGYETPKPQPKAGTDRKSA